MAGYAGRIYPDIEACVPLCRHTRCFASGRMQSSQTEGESNVRHRKPSPSNSPTVLKSPTAQESPAQALPKPNNRPCFGFCWRLSLAVVTLLLCLLIVIIAWPANFNPQEFHYKPAPNFKNALASNTLLTKAIKLHNGDIFGPEAIAIKDGVLYTGTSDGRVLKIENDTISTITSTGIKICSSGDSTNEAECGRPLGVRIDRHGNLMVVDSLYGLYKINVTTGVKDLLFSTRERLDGKHSMFLNDLVVASDGIIYISDSSTSWTRPDFLFLGLENNPDGRIIKVDPKVGSVEVLVDQIYANGLELSDDESELLIADTVRVQILKYHLTGLHKGQLEVFHGNLPGNPDNIRRSSGGGYWVALTAVRDPNKPQPVWEQLGPYPWLRGVLCKLTYVWRRPPISTLRNKIAPKKAKKRKTHGLVLEMDKEGEIMRSLHDPTGKIVGISHVEEDQGTLYLGSAFNPFIGKLDLKDVE